MRSRWHRQASLRRIAGLTAVALLATAGCGGEMGDDAADPSTTAPAQADASPAVSSVEGTLQGTRSDRGEGLANDGPAVPLDQLDPRLRTMVSNIGQGYERANGLWDGFVPNDHPLVIVVKDESGAVGEVIAINHPDPGALGTAEAIRLDGMPFNSLHRIADPVDRGPLRELAGIDVRVELGGIDSVAAIASSGADPRLDPTEKRYVSTLFHELFHRHQDEAFEPVLDPDVEGYAYTAQNLELAVLEERALSDALQADGDDGIRSAAARFAAIRLTRLSADGRVALDNSQERFEGAARYIEHRLADTEQDDGYHGDNFGARLITGFDKAFGMKETFGFNRWYSSGAAALRILDLLGVDLVAARVEAGESPAEILAGELGLSPSNMDEIVTEAKAAYDPRSELAGQAVIAADTANREPPVFDESAEGAPTAVYSSTGVSPRR